MITGQLIGREYLIPFVRSIAPAIQIELEKEVSVLTLTLLRKVKQEKLSGTVLKNRTGTLRRSINQRVTVTPTSITGIVGTNKSYAAAHEYGFDGQVTVQEHMRMMKKAWGHDLMEPKQVTVRSHSRHMVLPERSFLRSALREMDAEIKSGLKGALQRVKR